MMKKFIVYGLKFIGKKMRKENNLSIKLSTINYQLSTKGLTLIEIMVVVAILAIISSTYFQYSKAVYFPREEAQTKRSYIPKREPHLI